MNKELFDNFDISTPEFSLNHLKTYARVVSVYDGDTIKCIIPIFDHFFKFHVRLMGIDTCEIKSKQHDNKDLAVSARNRLIHLITHGASDTTPLDSKHDIEHFLNQNTFLVWLHCLEFDKYGRVLANIYSDPESTVNFSDILVQEHLAYYYDGGTKLTESQQIDALDI